MTSPDVRPQKVVIIGGGISGLSAAYYVQNIAEKAGLPIELSLLEKDGRLGGKIDTLHRDDFIIERGPDSFLARKWPVIELSQELGLNKYWVATGPQAKQTFVVHHKKMHPLPPGLMLGIPTQWTPFLKTGLISPLGKARAALDLILPKRKETGDESLGHFLERRLGREVVGQMAEPLLSGIYAGDAYDLSIQATFPQFQQLEQKYTSLIKGMMISKQRMQQTSRLPAMAQKSMFLSFQGGLSTLVKALASGLKRAQLRTQTAVKGLHKNESGYRLQLNDGQTLEADALILATPAFVTAQLLEEPELRQLLAPIRYVSVANVVLTFNQEDINVPLEGSGFVVPKKEGYTMTACTWTSSKWPHTAPEGKVLMRVYVGRAGQEDIVKQDDEHILSIVQQELRELTGLNAQPLFYEVNRWFQSMPQYQVGHVERLEQLTYKLNMSHPGLFLCGAGYRGVGIPDCIGQAKQAAQNLLAYLTKKAEP
ncbi:oxygen-dependent protoporphyrinogen oxidase [Caldalkalibacillus uzonensis]|uniref:Coproporphyrinogen III oxidase n=1 Tax=Caldalkalibacillus uzonensis TaxID=353224 RepID=A0ABU0CPR2_9BACI|nr:protoporphyrinogen oxidase [Caldalkalibacillus uzonensis]MDQ0338408.1 oxygen-dependent protoporphyrinogen oxidase [Caldalkalibacillus uzonensis]